ncbi:MAG: 6-phosphofructokinase, partial [Acidobacteria bacterium]|nr:6-phosphofructokinase [Acidobacteriota bacterium]
PTAFDRLLGSRYGSQAVRAAAEGKFGNMVALRSGNVVEVPLKEALAVPKRVNLQGDAIKTARALGISLGDG